MFINMISVNSSIFKKEMCTYSQRVATFKNWCKIQKSEDMAMCGFYFLGEKDNVRCFYCGIGLNNWLSTDSPWIEHALFSPRCTYLLLNKFKFQKPLLEDEPFTQLMVNQNYLKSTCFKNRITSNFLFILFFRSHAARWM